MIKRSEYNSLFWVYSSEAERMAVNHDVGGSIPSIPVIIGVSPSRLRHKTLTLVFASSNLATSVKFVAVSESGLWCRPAKSVCNNAPRVQITVATFLRRKQQLIQMGKIILNLTKTY